MAGIAKVKMTRIFLLTDKSWLIIKSDDMMIFPFTAYNGQALY
ncbi:hypothetical protein DOT_5472 [Desulfosporosinus sp. OT]|nr:hypothetical protein DOT_5472 [Desulfosporosinus sp. OT]